MRPAAHLLFFASPKKRRQKKGDPAGRVPALRCGQPAMLASGAVLRNSLRAARYAHTTAANQSTMHGHALLPMPAPAAALLGTARGDPKTRPAIAALGHALPCGAERSDGPCETPCGCACGAALAGWRVHRRMHALRALTRRGCLSAAAQPRSEFRGAPRKRRDAGLPRSNAKGSQTWGRFLLPTFLVCTRKVGAPPGAHPGQPTLAESTTHRTTANRPNAQKPLTPTLSPKGRGSKAVPRQR